MAEGKLGAVESRFADIVWAHAPLASRELARLCEQELGWKRTTTYNVLRKLCERGLFQNDGGTVRALVSREAFYCSQGEALVGSAFGGACIFGSVYEAARAQPQRNRGNTEDDRRGGGVIWELSLKHWSTIRIEFFPRF